jgi:hypothetical protein
MLAIDQSLNWVGSGAASNGPTFVSVGPSSDGQTYYAAVLSSSGTCFYLADFQASSTLYGVGYGACAAMMAPVYATQPSWP